MPRLPLPRTAKEEDMTNQDNLRNRIAELIEGLDDRQMLDDGNLASPDDIAQTIIDEFGLTVEAPTGFGITQQRIVGKWERQ